MTPIDDGATLAWAPTLGNAIAMDPIGAYRTFNLSSGAAGLIRGPTVPTDFHELQQLPNGNYLMLATPPLSMVNLSSSPNPALRSYNTIIDCVAEEFSPSGALVWKWDAYNHGGILPDEDVDGIPLDYNRVSAAPDRTTVPPLPMSPGGTNVLVSLHGTWTCCSTSRSPPSRFCGKFDCNSATPQGAVHITTPATGPGSDPEGGLSGQHDARILQVNAGDQPTEVSAFDDHSFTDDGSFGVQTGATDGALWGRVHDRLREPIGSDRRLDGTVRAPANQRRHRQLPDLHHQRDHPQPRLLGAPGQPVRLHRFRPERQSADESHIPGRRGGLSSRLGSASGAGSLDLNAMRATAGLPPPPPPSPNLQPIPSGTFTSGPALTSWTSTRYDIFGRGTDGALWHNWWTGSGWAGWQSLGGQIAPGTQPAAVAGAPNRIDVFVEGTDGQLYHIWWDGASWSGWEGHGGILSGSPAVASWAPNRLDVVVPGAGGGLWTTGWDGSTWSTFNSLGGGDVRDPGNRGLGP